MRGGVGNGGLESSPQQPLDVDSIGRSGTANQVPAGQLTKILQLPQFANG
jgi:hypothetical protein